MKYKNASSYSFWVRICLIIFFILLVVTVLHSGFYSYLTVRNIKEHAGFLRNYVMHSYWTTVWLYMAAFMLLIVCCLPGAALMSMLGGFLFGIFSGVFYINVVATTGATIVFLFVRYVIGTLLQRKYASQFQNFNGMISSTKGWVFLLLLRCTPLIPFFMVNIIAGLTTISVMTFVWTTSVGLLPTSFIFTYVGKELGRIKKLEDFFSLSMLGAVLLIVAFVTISIYINRKKYFSKKNH